MKEPDNRVGLDRRARSTSFTRLQKAILSRNIRVNGALLFAIYTMQVCHRKKRLHWLVFIARLCPFVIMSYFLLLLEFCQFLLLFALRPREGSKKPGDIRASSVGQVISRLRVGVKPEAAGRVAPLFLFSFCSYVSHVHSKKIVNT